MFLFVRENKVRRFFFWGGGASCSKVLFRHVWHAVQNIDQNISTRLQMLEEFDWIYKQYEVGSMFFFFSGRFVSAGCS